MRKFGTGDNVQDASHAGVPWSTEEDTLVGQYDQLDDMAISRLVHRLGRPPSEIRARHPIVLHKQEQQDVLARRRLLIEQIARKRNTIK